jgi:Bifunctional DNA primase/polymerase, N-terminal
MGYTHPPPTLAGWAAGGGRWPQANIGARVPANPLVVDLDPRHGGLGRLAELEREHGPLPATRVSISGRGDGGQHRWFLHPGGRLSATLRSAVVLAGRAIFVPFRARHHRSATVSYGHSRCSDLRLPY